MGQEANILVMQSGGPTPVFNRSLYGVITETHGIRSSKQIYGSPNGINGLLSSKLINLSHISKPQLARIARTPGAALGSSRRQLSEEDLPNILNVLSKYAIKYLFIIGGNDSADTGRLIGIETMKAGRPLSVINVPKTIDNDLVNTHHSPGYGSAARFIALATMGAGQDAKSMGSESPIIVIEVMGRDAGWLAASSSLGRRDEKDAPHVICIPEAPVHEEGFLSNIENAYQRFGFAVAVVAENTRGINGVLGGEQEPWYIDDFGHPYYEGAGHYLANLISTRLKIRTRYEKPGTIQRSMTACISRTDVNEAEMVGRAAVRSARQGAFSQMVTLVKKPQENYACSTSLTPLDQVAGKTLNMPTEYFDKNASYVTKSFLDYARPLIGTPLPRFGNLHSIL